MNSPGEQQAANLDTRRTDYLKPDCMRNQFLRLGHGGFCCNAEQIAEILFQASATYVAVGTLLNLSGSGINYRYLDTSSLL